MNLKNLKNLNSPKYRISLLSLGVIGAGTAYIAISNFGGESSDGAGNQAEAKVNINSINDGNVSAPTSDDYANAAGEMAQAYEQKRSDEKEAAMEGDGSFVFTINDGGDKSKPAVLPVEKVEKDLKQKPTMMGDLEGTTKKAVEKDKPREDIAVNEAPPTNERPPYQEQLTKTLEISKTQGQARSQSGLQQSTVDLTAFMESVRAEAAFTYPGNESGRQQSEGTVINTYTPEVGRSQPAPRSSSGGVASGSKSSGVDSSGNSTDYANYIGLSPTVVKQKTVRISAGDIAYTRLQIGINTDEVSPIRAEILSGPLEGAVLLGTPSRTGEKAIIQLNKMSFNGADYDIDAVALDLETNRTAMADDVDTHFGKNLFYLTVASVMAGYADSLQSWEETSSNTDAVSTKTTQRLDKFSDRVLVGLGDAGEEVKDVFKDRINRAPTVYVYPKDIGIMFMSSFVMGQAEGDIN